MALRGSRKWTPRALLATLTVVAAADYKLEDTYVGIDILDKWDFFTDPDPANGHVNYVDVDTAWKDGLAVAYPNRLYLGADRTTKLNGTKRRSVRVHSKSVYNGGLFIVDVEHMPVGCGTWPAFWMYGEDAAHRWPSWGEFDIIETMHNNNQAMTTLHTGAECSQSEVHPQVDFNQQWKLGENGLPANDCDVNAAGQYRNQGCSQAGLPESAGPGFNARGGGTFAGEWDPVVGHIRTWFWPTDLVPLDVRKRKPDPSKWGTPASYFSLMRHQCTPEHFRNMRLVFNVDLCGDLGNALFAESCPMEAKNMTCDEYVSDPANLAEAFWSIRALDVYTRKEDLNYVLFAEHPERYPLQPPQGNILNSVLKSTAFATALLVFGLSGLALLAARWTWRKASAFTSHDSDVEQPMVGSRAQASPDGWFSRAWGGSSPAETGRTRGRSTSSESSAFWSASKPRSSSLHSASSDRTRSSSMHSNWSWSPQL